MRRHAALVLLLAGGLQLPASPVPAESGSFLGPVEPGSPGAVSRTQRFVFRDFDRADGTMLAAWVEDVASAVESHVGRILPFRRFELVRISAADGIEGSVYVGQGFADSLMQQRIVVTKPEAVSEDAFREAMVQVLLDRYVLAASASKPDGAVGRRVPDWLAVGTAHFTDTNRRKSDAAFVAEQWRKGESRTVARCLGQIRLPAGASDDKAFCSQLVAWMSRELRGPMRWYDVLLRLADEEAVDLKWISEAVFDADSPREVEKEWDLWLARQTLVHRTLGTVDPERIGRVRALLDIRLANYGFSASPGVPDRLTVYDLIEHRDEPWAQRVASLLSGELQAVSVGQAAEFVAVTDALRNALLAITPGNRRFIRNSSVRRDFEQAEADLARLEQDLTVRSQYLEGVERLATRPSEEPPPPAAGIEDQRRRFLEQIERQRRP